MNSSKLKIPLIQEALSSGGLVLEIGAGIDRCRKKNLIKTDAFLYSKDLDYIADAHALPFSNDTFDYVYALAVFEHLHSPWVAADEIFRVLKPSGKVYVLSAFNQHIHGYPHHYFNMTDMGLRRIFSKFDNIQCVPSPNCPLREITVSHHDLLKMVKSLEKREPSQACHKLHKAILEIIRILPKLEKKLIEDKRVFEYWKRIAPGFDLYATKPH